MISKILTHRGMTMDMPVLLAALAKCWPGDPYALKKACGATGGARTHHFISIGANGKVTRIR